MSEKACRCKPRKGPELRPGDTCSRCEGLFLVNNAAHCSKCGWEGYAGECPEVLRNNPLCPNCLHRVDGEGGGN